MIVMERAMVRITAPDGASVVAFMDDEEIVNHNDNYPKDTVTRMEIQQFVEPVNVAVICPFCVKEDVITVERNDYISWREGELIQNAMPYLNNVQREQLISGMCGPCWDRFI